MRDKDDRRERNKDDRGRTSSPRTRASGRRRVDYRDKAPCAQQQHEDQYGESERRRDELDRQDIQPARRLCQEEPGGDQRRYREDERRAAGRSYACPRPGQRNDRKVATDGECVGRVSAEVSFVKVAAPSHRFLDRSATEGASRRRHWKSGLTGFQRSIGHNLANM